MSITSESLPYPTREISDNLPLFLSEIGAVAVPIPVTGTQPIVAIKGSTYITYGSGTITFTDPNISTSVSGDYYKVIVGGTSAAVIGGVTYNVASPIEILRLVSAGAWITYGGLNASQISGTFTGNVIGNLTGNVTGTVSGNSGGFTGSLGGQVTGTQSNTAIAATTVTAKVLTGYASTTGTISTADTILSAIGKLNGNKAEAVVPIVLVSTATTFNEASNTKIYHASGTTTLTLPVASTVSDGWSIGIVNVGGSPLTVNRSNTNTINGTLTTFSNTVPYSAVYIYKSSATAFIAVGILY